VLLQEGPVQDAYLILRGRQYYLKLAIPRPIRHLFPSGTGKPRDYIVEALGPDRTPAGLERDHRVALYRTLFARAALMTPEAIKDELAAIKRQIERRKLPLPPLQRELERLEADPAFREESAAEFLRVFRERLRSAPFPEKEEVTSMAINAALVAGLKQKTPAGGETINQAAEAWFTEMRRPDAGIRPQTLDGHRLRVRAFVEHAGDIPLATVTRKMAADFLTHISAGRSGRTTNNYATTMMSLFKYARDRGLIPEGAPNPFEDQRRKVVGEEREAFNSAEVQKLFAALPIEVAPKKHSPETALPWAVRIAAYSGMRLEEIAQLTVPDIQRRGTNGGTVVVFDIHNGDNEHHIKNGSSARAVPIHSALVRAGLLNYAQALPQDGLLFPGLKRRASKGGKIGARLGELFRKRLIAIGLKREGLCFHSLRHTLAERLEAAAVSQTDAARVLGHAIEGMSYGTYSSGPGLIRLAAVVEEIRYDD